MEGTVVTTGDTDRKAILIRNCDNAITEKEVRAIFSSLGDIRDLKKQFDQELNEFCWYLEYAHQDSAKDAIEAFQHYKLLGKELHIGYTGEVQCPRAGESQKVNTNQCIIDFLKKLTDSAGYPCWESVAAHHQDYVTVDVKTQIDSNTKELSVAIREVTDFLATHNGKIYQSWLYNDLKEIATESTLELLEAPAASAVKLEEAIANENYLFFEKVPHSIPLDNLRAKLQSIASAQSIEIHELESNDESRKVIVDMGSTELNTTLVLLQVLVLENVCIPINVAKKRA